MSRTNNQSAIGKRVMVICSDQKYASGLQPFPPVGTEGTVIEGIDEYGEYEVIFDEWPATAPLDPAWCVHSTLIVFIDDESVDSKLLEAYV